MKKALEGYRIHMPLCRFDSPVTHTAEEYDFPDRLYQPHWEKASAWGIAHRLMSLAKEQAERENRRAIILETQSCNVGAIRFYLSEGFEPIGFDSCCYSNRDLERREVRINMGYFPKNARKGEHIE